jgi:anti-sigma B factor antagonist
MIPQGGVEPSMTGPPDDPIEAREREVMNSLSGSSCESPLQLQVVERAGFPVVRVQGELDIYTVEAFQAEIGRVQRDGAQGIVVDMSATSFVDSKGLGALLRAARVQPGAVVVVTTQERIIRLFRAVGLAETIPVYHSVPEAVDALRRL